MVVHLELNDQEITLIGFALRARQMVKGFEGVMHHLRKNKIAFVMLSEDISADSKRKVENLARSKQVPVIMLQRGLAWRQRLGIDQFKVLALQRGEISRQFLKKLKTRSQWQ